MPKIKRPHDYQEQAITDIFDEWLDGVINVCLVAPTGAGKCLGKDTPVLMYNGSIKMVQDITVGETLMGPDSKKRKVMSTCTGKEMLYKITPVKGESYTVNESHILSLKRTGDKNTIKGGIVNITVKDYLSKSNYWKHCHKGYRTGVEFQSKSIGDECLPPYLLGVWLGDGSSYHATITTADVEIVDYLNKFTIDTNQQLRKETMINNKSSNYCLSNLRMRIKPSTRKSLKSNNLLNNKHIPNKYKMSNRQDRLELLAGLLDSDGHLSKGCYDVIFKNEILANDTVYLARSLGFASYIKPCRKTCCNNGVTKTYFRLSISGDVSVIPTKIKRHQPPTRKQKKDVLVTGIKVEPVGVGDYYGFEITGDRLFLLGDFTVTHNTIIKAFVAKRWLAKNPDGVAIIFAHRDILLNQIAMSIAMVGIPHRMLCSKATERLISNAQIEELGETFITDNSRLIIASVPTWIKRDTTLLDEAIGLWLLDECHHCLADNMWGLAVKPLVNAIGLGVTATPKRADNKGLGRHTDGVFDSIVETPGMGELINRGRLSDYKVYTPLDRVDMTGVNKTKGGDWNQLKLAKATDKAEITGDAYKHYKRLADGKQGIIFAASIAHADHVAKEFRDKGVNAVSLSSKSKEGYRQQKIREFRQGKIDLLVNYDLFGEGFDVPAVAVIQMLRKTESYALFMQMFGRGLRVFEGKKFGILIDHVGNVDRHCRYLEHVHDSPVWTLDRYDDTKKSSNDGLDILSRTCPKCRNYYKPSSANINSYVCPQCTHKETQEQRDETAKKRLEDDGILVEYDTGWQVKVMAQIKKVDELPEDMKARMTYANMSHMIVSSAVKKHTLRQTNQTKLRYWVVQWCNEIGFKKGLSISIVQGEFNKQFGHNVFVAQTISASEAKELTNKIIVNMLDKCMFN